MRCWRIWRAETDWDLSARGALYVRIGLSYVSLLHLAIQNGDRTARRPGSTRYGPPGHRTRDSRAGNLRSSSSPMQIGTLLSRRWTNGSDLDLGLLHNPLLATAAQRPCLPRDHARRRDAQAHPQASDPKSYLRGDGQHASCCFRPTA